MNINLKISAVQTNTFWGVQDMVHLNSVQIDSPSVVKCNMCISIKNSTPNIYACIQIRLHNFNAWSESILHNTSIHHASSNIVVASKQLETVIGAFQ